MKINSANRLELCTGRLFSQAMPSSRPSLAHSDPACARPSLFKLQSSSAQKNYGEMFHISDLASSVWGSNWPTLYRPDPAQSPANSPLLALWLIANKSDIMNSQVNKTRLACFGQMQLHFIKVNSSQLHRSDD
jgi:hypothetical protein